MDEAVLIRRTTRIVVVPEKGARVSLGYVMSKVEILEELPRLTAQERGRIRRS